MTTEPDKVLQDELIAAYTAWEEVAASPPEGRPSSLWLKAQTDRKQDALQALGLNPCKAHDAIARYRTNRYDVPSAVQAAIQELAPTTTSQPLVPDLKEAS